MERFVPTLVAAPGITFAWAKTSGAVGCGLTFLGLAHCWGGNTDGSVGDGTLTARLAPVPVQMPAGNTFAQLSVGGNHVCALTTGAAGYCWGGGSGGALGIGTQPFAQSTPAAVAMPAGVTFASISAGSSHSCAVTPPGAVYCWGLNASGQLGDGTVTLRNAPVRVQR